VSLLRFAGEPGNVGMVAWPPGISYFFCLTKDLLPPDAEPDKGHP
jgi:hypothetical protein